MAAKENYELFGETQEGDYTLRAWLPTHSNQMLVEAYRDEEVVGSRSFLLSYEPRFGLDVSDIQKLELETDELLKELGL